MSVHNDAFTWIFYFSLHCRWYIGNVIETHCSFDCSCVRACVCACSYAVRMSQTKCNYYYVRSMFWRQFSRPYSDEIRSVSVCACVFCTFCQRNCNFTYSKCITQFVSWIWIIRAVHFPKIHTERHRRHRSVCCLPLPLYTPSKGIKFDCKRYSRNEKNKTSMSISVQWKEWHPHYFAQTENNSCWR